MARLPNKVRWLFWEMDFQEIDAVRDADFVLARVLEHGCLPDVQWAIRRYGLARIHLFFKTVGHPEVSPRTTRFWRVVLKAGREQWASAPAWRRTSRPLWPG